MNSKNINKIFKSEKKYLGTFPCDKLPKIKKYPAALIANTDNSKLPGQHWVAIYIDKNKIGEYFDPYGLPPINKEFIKYLNTFSKKWSHYNKPIQSSDPNSKVCGEICIIYISCKITGFKNKIIKDIFKKRKTNDLIAGKVIKIFKKIHNGEK